MIIINYQKWFSLWAWLWSGRWRGRVWVGLCNISIFTSIEIFFKYRIKVSAFLLIPDIEIPKISKKLTRLLLDLIITAPWLTKITSCQQGGWAVLYSVYFHNAFPL